MDKNNTGRRDRKRDRVPTFAATITLMREADLADLKAYLDQRFEDLARQIKVHSDLQFDGVTKQLNRLQNQGGRLMGKATEIQEVLGKIDTATDEVAKDLDALRSQITGGLTEAEAVEVTAKLDALKVRLEAMGKDPEDPAPV